MSYSCCSSQLKITLASKDNYQCLASSGFFTDMELDCVMCVSCQVHCLVVSKPTIDTIMARDLHCPQYISTNAPTNNISYRGNTLNV